MRSGIDSLSGLVRNELHQNPLSGDIFIFLNRKASHIKLLMWDRDGFALYYKRLEKGTYEKIAGENTEISYQQRKPYFTRHKAGFSKNKTTILHALQTTIIQYWSNKKILKKVCEKPLILLGFTSLFEYFYTCLLR